MKSKTSSSKKRSWAVVTGASQGIGKAICEKLAASGWSLVLVSRNLKKLEQVAKTLPGEHLCRAVDLNSKASIEKFSKDLKLAFKGQKLKALVNNAGVFDRRDFNSTPDQMWEEILQVNLLAPARLCRNLYPLLKTTSGAAIVNISSTLGLKPVANTAAYSASKAGLNSLTLSLAKEWAPDIRVNAICPGLIDTPIHAFHKEKETSVSRKSAHQAQPLGRLGKPEDIASAVEFLLSDESNWTTGSIWNVDGGIQLT